MSVFTQTEDSVDMQDTLSPIVFNRELLPRNSTTSTFDSTFQILHHREHGQYAQRVLYLHDLGLVIKHGPRTTISEGQTLWVLAKYCPQVRIPTVYGCQQLVTKNMIIYKEM